MKTFATHNGPFHADDVLSYVILTSLGLSARLIRTRNPQEMVQADIVFDVGDVYEPATGRFDHHQKGGAGTRPNGVPYAACGLIWKHFGVRFCAPYAEAHEIDATDLANAIDAAVIEGIDATDCGAIEGRVKLKGTESDVGVKSISLLVNAFNPAPLVDAGTPEDFDRAFLAAAEAIKPFFERLIRQEISRLKAAAVVNAADDGGPILLLDAFCPWQEVVCEWMPHIKFVVFSTPTGHWNCQTVPKRIGGFISRKDLPASWAGLQNEALAAETGVTDAVFCHNGRFIAGAKSKEGALRLAELALQS